VVPTIPVFTARGSAAAAGRRCPLGRAESKGCTEREVPDFTDAAVSGGVGSA
jgi:hypothetical protein